jgi:hypothetical protein
MRTPVRPLPGAIVSRSLRPGDRAWYVRAGEATLVLVTARRGLRVIITRPDLDAEEGIAVRRTRVLLVPERRP